MSTEETHVLSSQQIESFAERGVLKLDLGFSADLLNDIVEQVQPLYEPAYQQNQLVASRVQDAWQQLDSVRQLAVDAKVLAALEQLLDRKPLPFQTLPTTVRSSRPGSQYTSLRSPLGWPTSPHRGAMHAMVECMMRGRCPPTLRPDGALFFVRHCSEPGRALHASNVIALSPLSTQHSRPATLRATCLDQTSWPMMPSMPP